MEIRPLKEVNEVSCLNLIWRILSLWVKWIQVYLIIKGSFWSIKRVLQQDHGCGGKFLGQERLQESYHRIGVKSGASTSFWYDHWSSIGRLKDLLGYVDMCIPENLTIAEAIQIHNRRNHRIVILNRVEEEMEKNKV